MKKICYEKGFGFKSGLKIKDSSHTASILRTIEKLVEDDLKDLKTKKIAKVSDLYDPSKTYSHKEIKALIDD